jgi:hypothetical protein
VFRRGRYAFMGAAPILRVVQVVNVSSGLPAATRITLM